MASAPIQPSSLERRFKAMTPTLILVVLALVFAVLSIPWGQYHLLPVAVIFLAVALLIGK
jgi:uncharacterized ion transporter superfamily protein YfcC